MSGHETADQLRTAIAKEGQQERSRGIVHSVSIVVESVHDDCDALPAYQAATNDSSFAQELTADTAETARPRKERHQSSPMIFLNDHLPGTCLAHP